MWTRLANHRLEKAASRNAPITAAELDRARSVLFAVFSRYGDSVITFKVLDEFLRRYPGKRCTLVTTPQTLPYAQAIIRSDVRYVAINKRRSVLSIARLIRDLRRDPPDLGFNPWSHGKESQALISYARRFYPFADFAATVEWRNHYQRVRQYLHLPDPAVSRPDGPPEKVARIVVAPFSTDPRRSLSAEDVAHLLRLLEMRHPSARVTLALFAREAHAVEGLGGARFFFGKTRRHSEQFLALLRDCDLFVGVDAGPLHLADALGKPVIAIFGPTAPETVLDGDSHALILRAASMRGVSCDVRSCDTPICLHQLMRTEVLTPKAREIAGPVRVETKVCRALEVPQHQG